MGSRGKVIDSLLLKIDAVPFCVEAAYVTGRLRAILTRAGTPIGPYDVMIAGTALVHGLILVTANTREFSRVFGLQLENWRLHPTEVRESPGEYRVKVRSRRRIQETAANLVATAMKSLPSRKVRQTLERLVAEDGYGTRAPLADVLATLSHESR